MKAKRLIMRSAILVAILAMVSALLIYSLTSEGNSAIGVGDTAPNFIVNDLEGNQIELADLKGKGVFLNFWGTYCPPCEKEMPYMENQYNIFKDQGVEILAVNVRETNLPVKRFVERYDLSFPIPMDPDGELVQRYGVIPLPTTFLINSEGIVTQVITGTMTEEDIEKYMESIKP
ncbi:thiol-disulfide oxidoreductase ResA [Shouchella sp. 1P09AA]|uniref:thiol-disulfide oxidoreductase ResA n=1 Tax=unclassified Shouchella TaxID=2893065 RepID=UPI0039A0CE97